MKVTVNFGRTGVVVPCKDTWKVQDLINQATQRYRRLLEQDGEFVVRTHHVEYADGGILDPDDMLTDLLEDRDKLIAVYEEMELQSSHSRAISPGGSVASGYSSPYTSEPELGLLRPAVSTEIEVTPRTLKSNTPLLVRSSSEMILPRSTDFLTPEPDTSNSRSTPTGGGVRVIVHGLTVKPVTMDSPKQDLQTSRTTRDPDNTFSNSNSGLTRTVQLTGVTTGPLGIKVVPYCSSLSGRTLGLHIKSIEEKSRTKEEGIFEEDECIVQINDTPLIDKSFSESQEIFRQAMSSTLVQLEVLLVSNRLQYEKSLIGQIFTSSDLLPNAPPKPRSPFLLRTTDPASTSQTPLPREEQPIRQSPVQTERREETPPPPVRASPTPRSQSESPASVRSSTLTVLANTVNKKGSRKRIDLNKGPDGLGFTVVTRDSSVHGTGPILVKSILPRGAAIRDGRLQSGDRLLEVNGVDVSTFRQEDLVAMLRRTKQGQTISLLVSRPEEPFLPRELKGEALGPPLPEDGRDQLMFEIPVNDSGSAGLGVSLKGNKSRETGEDLGIFIKSIIHGGAAFKDGRLWVNDQLLAVNGESLVGRSNHDAMETLRRSMSMEGNLRGTIQLVILRAQQEGGPTREGSPFQNSRTDGVSHPPMVNNSIYQHVPGLFPASNGRPRAYEDHFDDDFPSPPSDLETMESDFNKGPSQNRAKREPVLVASRPMTSQNECTPTGPEFYLNRASKSMDLVADESNFGAMKSQRPAPSYSVGPTLGLQKSSSLESLQTAMEEVSKPEVPFHRPVGPMVRGRGCNMSFRQAIDKSYDGLSEPEEDYSEGSSGRDTPASSSSRQELDDGAKEKKKKTKKKKEKKSKAKKKDDGGDPEKKTKKKGFALLRFGKKNKVDKAKGKLGSLSEEELDKSEAEAFSYGTDVDRSLPNRIEVEDDDYDPNYARINNFRDPSEKTPNLSHMSAPNYGPPPGPIQNISGPKEDPREGLYAKVSKLKPASQQPTNSNDARLQQIRSQLQYLKPAGPLHPEPGAAPRLQEYDPSRIRGPDPRMAPKYEDRQYASVPRRSPAQIHQPHSGPQQPSSLPRSGPYRYDLPPSPHLGQRGAPSYESATRGRTPDPDQYRASGDGQYPKYSHKNATIGAV